MSGELNGVCCAVSGRKMVSVLAARLPVVTYESSVTVSAPVELQIDLRWGDMDINGHVNNVQYARLLEEARVRALTRWFPAETNQLRPLVVRQDIEFRAPLVYTGEPTTVRMAVTRVGGSSYTLAATITAADGTLSVVASTVMVMVDPHTGRPSPMPQEARALLEEHRGELPALRAQG